MAPSSTTRRIMALQRDWLSEDLPNDELNRLTKVGQHFGYPYCHQGDFADPEFGWGKSCDDFVKPVTLLGPHSAPLGMRFYTGKMFPSKYQGAISVGAFSYQQPRNPEIATQAEAGRHRTAGRPCRRAPGLWSLTHRIARRSLDTGTP